MKDARISGRTWFNIIVFGFMGQVAWAVENIYFNTFLFNYIGGTTKDISTMVALTAATAVIATFLMGNLSDRLDRRKVFLFLGYILWGFSVMVFAFISRDNVAKLFGLADEVKILAASVSVVIIMDCVMTFIGSTSNDAAFNAWITDITVPENRGKAEGILASFPILATLLVTVAFGAGVAAAGYPACFLGLGIGVSLCGLIGAFTLKDSREGKPRRQGRYITDLIYGFRPSVIKENALLYLALLAVSFFNIAVQIFLPYLFIYLQHYMGFDFENLNITPKVIGIAVVAIVLFIAVVYCLGLMVDKFGKDKFIYPSIALFIIGLIATSQAKKLGAFAATVVMVFAGYGLLMIILNASVRDFTPEDKTGLFQGVRMIFMVLLPMVIGPPLGNAVIERFAPLHQLGTYYNDFGEAVYVPVPEIFLAAAIFSVLIGIPIFFLRKKAKAQNKKGY
ncbi:MAG: MFS transporter [Clostridiales bacterium]|jgi:MFS family permease|nr:MFS transporter [Clostridiales bacterium]